MPMEHTFTGLYCTRCGQLQREDHAGEPCQRCGEREFAAVQPNWEWILTPADRRFLKVNRIHP